MITTLDHDLGDVRVTIARQEVCGVDVVMERHTTRAGKVKEHWYLDPARLLHLKLQERKRLGRSHATLADARAMLEENLHLMRN